MAAPALWTRLPARSRCSPPLHDDTLHRVLNACQPGTYVQPHRHWAPPNAETMVLRGAIGVVVFGEGGRITQEFVLRAGSDQFGVGLHARV